MRNRSQVGLVALMAVLALTFVSLPALALNPPYDALTLTCVGSGPNSVTIDVRAGNTGAPAGFSLQWMSVADYEANGFQWFSSDDPRLCKMSFSGQPSFTGAVTSTRWELGPGDDVEIEIGDFLYDETGASGALADDGTGHFTQPDCQLKCGTAYYFRAFPHASRFNSRGPFTFISDDGNPELTEPGASCTTSDCGSCTLTQGYWKTHGPVGCQTGNNSDTWMESSWPTGVPTGGGPVGPVLKLGTVNYSPSQICSILNSPAKGNGLIALAHQLIAAKLNALVNGATCDAADIATADALVGSRIIPPVGSGFAKPKDTSASVNALDAFNNGYGCANHCKAPQFHAAPVQQTPWGKLKVRYR